METSIIFPLNRIDNSITNPTAKVTTDNIAPFSFFDFLRNTSAVYSPSEYNDFYQSYLKAWYETSNNQIVDETAFIAQLYVDLFKQITLTYTTVEERRFLANIDFKDPEDLEIVIPFYARKIKEIALLYKDRRDQVKFVVEKNKRKTTHYGIERAIKENIIDFLFQNPSFHTLNYSHSALSLVTDIEIEELVDTFGAYLNLAPTPSSYGSSVREEEYSSNFNEITFPEDLTKNIFKNVFFLELGVNFTINVNLNYDPTCQPSNPIGYFIDRKTVDGVSPDDLNKLRQRLLEKYVGVDYYYVQRDTNNEVVSGKFLTAANPSGNLLNIKNASTATVPSDQLLALKKVGIFFNEDKMGVLRFNSSRNAYYIDTDKIENNKTYVFPDPSVYGDVFNYQDTPLVFTIDNTVDVRNYSNSYAYGDPKVSPKDQTYFAYYSKQQAFNTDDINRDGMQENFQQLYNRGYAQNWKEDIFGNEYGLFKDPFGQYFYGSIPLEEVANRENVVKFLPFNGWVFNFNIGDNVSGYEYVVNSHLTLSGADTFTSDPVDIYLNFRGFNPYQDIPSYYNLYPSISGITPLLLSSDVLSGANTVYSNITGSNAYVDIRNKRILQGKLFVKNIVTNLIYPLSTALSATFTKYPSVVQNEVYENIQTFDLYYDTICLQTPNYVLFDRVAFSNSGFEYPSTVNNYVSASDTALSKISNRFFVPANNEVFFYVTKVYSEFENDSAKIIYPELYKYQLKENKITKLFPTSTSQLLSLSSNFSFATILSNINIVEVDSIRLAYNSYNELFALTYVGKDSNKSPYIFDFKIQYKYNAVTIDSSNIYDIHSDKNTSNFYCASTNSTSVSTISASNAAFNYIPLNLSFYQAFNSDTFILNITGGYLQF